MQNWLDRIKWVIAIAPVAIMLVFAISEAIRRERKGQDNERQIVIILLILGLSPVAFLWYCT